MESSVVTTKGQVVIPVELRRRHKIVKGTKVCFFERDGEIVLQPITDEFIDAVAGSVKGGRGAMSAFLRERRRERDREERKLKESARRWKRER